MMTNIESPSLHEAKKYIYSLDFTPVINKMIQHLGWKKQEAHLTCQLYRNFLFLQKKYGHNELLPPSDEIDEFWHNHILDTAKYRQDCQMIFGKYLDHYPYFGIDDTSNKDDLNKAFESIQKLHKAEFGYSIERVRKLKFSELCIAVWHALKTSFKTSTI